MSQNAPSKPSASAGSTYRIAKRKLTRTTRIRFAMSLPSSRAVCLDYVTSSPPDSAPSTPPPAIRSPGSSSSSVSLLELLPAFLTLLPNLGMTLDAPGRRPNIHAHFVGRQREDGLDTLPARAAEANRSTLIADIPFPFPAPENVAAKRCASENRAF